MDDVIVRAATQTDVAAIAAIFQRTRNICMAYLPVMHSPAEDLEFFSGCVKNDSVWVAEDAQSADSAFLKMDGSITCT